MTTTTAHALALAGIIVLASACDGTSPEPDASLDRGTADTAPIDALPAPDTRCDAGNPCQGSTLAVEEEKSRVNHCTDGVDCAFINGSCPFGCHILHHRNEDTTKLKKLIAAHEQLVQDGICPKCTYKCAPPGSIACDGSRCVMTPP